MAPSLDERLRSIAGGSNRLSVAYKRAAWISLIPAVIVWYGFALAALGFYLAAMALRREGL